MPANHFLYRGSRRLDPDFLEAAAQGAPMKAALVGTGSHEARETARMAQDSGIAEIIPIQATDETAMITEACHLARQGQVDCLIKGHIHTDVYMRGILERNTGLRCNPGTRIVHVFAMIPPQGTQPLIISDAALNPAPDLATHQQIIRCTIDVAEVLGIKTPKIAILSATESQLARVPSSIRAAELCDWLKGEKLPATIAGPLALDGAIAPEAAAIKGMANQPIAGDADVLIVPDIVSGNILFKALVWFSGAYAAGVVLGVRVPVILTSRADPPEARLASIALAKRLHTAHITSDRDT